MSRKQTCPNCNSKFIAKIFWGYPGDFESMEEQVERKEIDMGGCLVSSHDPEWECNECGNQWGKRKDD